MSILNAASLLIVHPLSLMVGIIPVILWLWFLEHEDKNPEPKGLTALAFIAGMVGVFIVFPLEKLVSSTVDDTIIIFLLWAAIEEIVKFVLAYFIVLRRRENDEPIDSVMYLIAVALGFAALENAFFLLGPALDNQALPLVIMGNFRFIGATLLHTTASGAIGIALALSYYKKVQSKRIYLASGLILAIVLHALFNLSIIGAEGNNIIFSYYAVWIAIVLLFLLFEKVKHISKAQ